MSPECSQKQQRKMFNWFNHVLKYNTSLIDMLETSCHLWSVSEEHNLDVCVRVKINPPSIRTLLLTSQLCPSDALSMIEKV